VTALIHVIDHERHCKAEQKVLFSHASITWVKLPLDWM